RSPPPATPPRSPNPSAFCSPLRRTDRPRIRPAAGAAAPMKRNRILATPSGRRRDEFLDAVRRSRKLHGRWVSAPDTPENFDAYLRRLRRATHPGYWVLTDSGELAGVININEI